ncbi:MAG: helix-hairpin-helix domain-containing protein [Fibromonadaceae bacterium]|jgi:competence protein ComEA|nr:helix-hairpin-helix domain-containing protein [Fibromonadaceae bacterium]
MNAAEKKFLSLALFLFALGGASQLGFLNKVSPLESVFLPVNHEIVSDTISVAAIAGDSIAVDSEAIEEEKEEVRTAAVKAASKQRTKKRAPAFPININTASKDDLCFIKGVGPSIAQRIIEHREQKGDFRTARDLEKVPGIGTKKRQAMEEFVRFE